MIGCDYAISEPFPFSSVAFEKLSDYSNTDHDHAEEIKIGLLVNNYFHSHCVME